MSDNDNSSKDTPIRKRVSLVWQYFEKLSSEKVKCRICQHEQRYMGNTANALRHLKAKHDIDARAVGLKDPENVKRMKSLNVSSIPFEQAIAGVNIKNECRYNDDENVSHEQEEQEEEEEAEAEELETEPEVKPNRNRAQISYYETDGDIDPYVHNEEPLVDFVDTNNYHNHSKHHEDSLDFNRNSRTLISKKRTSLEDERIIAETEYFREKAAYFRVQKHLAALQARKIKFELEQLCSK